MDDCDAALDHATREIATLLATAYLLFRAPQRRSGASCKRCLGCPKVQKRLAIVEGVASP